MISVRKYIVLDHQLQNWNREVVCWIIFFFDLLPWTLWTKYAGSFFNFSFYQGREEEMLFDLHCTQNNHIFFFSFFTERCLLFPETSVI